MVAYSFKHQFIGPIRAGLGIEHLNERGKIVIPGPTPKRQTIRAVGKRRHARPGEVLQLYYGMRTKQCMSIGVSRCVSVEPIEIAVLDDAILLIRIGEPLKALSERDMEQLARNDGFGSLEDMWLFWRREHGLGVFNGLMIKWEPIT
jgi:hypothetical protein